MLTDFVTFVCSVVLWLEFDSANCVSCSVVRTSGQSFMSLVPIGSRSESPHFVIMYGSCHGAALSTVSKPLAGSD